MKKLMALVAAAVVSASVYANTEVVVTEKTYTQEEVAAIVNAVTTENKELSNVSNDFKKGFVAGMIAGAAATVGGQYAYNWYKTPANPAPVNPAPAE